MKATLRLFSILRQLFKATLRLLVDFRQLLKGVFHCLDFVISKILKNLYFCDATWQFLTAIGGPTLSRPPAHPSEARRVAPHLRAARGSHPLHATLSEARRRRWAAVRCGEIGAAPEGLGCHSGSKTFRGCYLPMAGSGPIPAMGPHRLWALWARWQGTSTAQSRPVGNFGRCLLPCHRA